jgi:c-di-AMP phosphodiesterase-like protein
MLFGWSFNIDKVEKSNNSIIIAIVITIIIYKHTHIGQFIVIEYIIRSLYFIGTLGTKIYYRLMDSTVLKVFLSSRDDRVYTLLKKMPIGMVNLAKKQVKYQK